MNSGAVERFLSSMVMDFDKWHDGIGYDLDALDEMAPEERSDIEQRLVSKLDDWRDLEALDHLGTPNAVAAILRARTSSNQELRLAAQDYGPEPEADVREAAILAGLGTDLESEGLSKAIDQAAEHPTPRVIDALLRCARDLTGPSAYSAAAALYYVKGKIESNLGLENRAFFLRFVDDDEDHRAAFQEMCDELGLESGEPG
jgi:hypothetical protein